MKLKPDHQARHIKAGSAECARLCRKPDPALKRGIDMDREIRRSAWGEARHVKSVRKLEREAAEAQRERSLSRRWIRIKCQATWGESGVSVRRSATSHRAIIMPSRGYALPRYGSAVRDKRGLLFPFQRTRYSSASGSKQGRARDLARYGIHGAHVFEDGVLAFASNVGDSPEEIGEAFDQLERVNRSAAKNAKIVHHMIIQSLHELPPEEQLAMAKRYCEYVFGRQDLPYSLALHPPSEEGDQRNWHIHVVYSYRPMARIGEDEWQVGRHLRSDLDTPEQWTRMRFLLAEELNHSCEKAGLAKRYTHLSYAAAGLDLVPQQHLGPGLTAMVRRGETVRTNTQNHRVVVENSARQLIREVKAQLRVAVSACQEGVRRELDIVRLAKSASREQRLASEAPTMLRGITLPKSMTTTAGRGRRDVGDPVQLLKRIAIRRQPLQMIR